MENNHVTTLEIDLKAIDHNLHFFKSKLNNSTKILIVIKAFGYGGDAVQVAQYIEPKVDYFAVAYADEGIALRNAGIKKPILVLHPQKSNILKIIEYNLEATMYSVGLLKSLIEIVQTEQLTNIPIHLKFNTGLNRLGFNKSDVPEIVSLINKQKNTFVKSIFLNIAASGGLNGRE